MIGVRDVMKKHKVIQILVTFSGSVDVSEAQNPAIYRMALPGKKGSYTARNAKVIKLKSAVFNPANDTVTLTPLKPFKVTKPIQARINGQPPSGLQDGSGRLIDGDRDGTAGGDVVALLSRRGASIQAVAAGATVGQGVGIMAIVDALFERDAFAGLAMAHRPRRPRPLSSP